MIFHQEYLNEWWDSDKDLALRCLAREYHERTEAFDQLHCHARNEKGFAVPRGEEWVICNRNARVVWAELAEKARSLSFCKQEFDQAIHEEVRHFESDCHKGMRYVLAKIRMGWDAYSKT